MHPMVPARPSSRVSQHSWHLGAKGFSVSVAMYGRGKRATDGWEFYPCAQVVWLDIDFLSAEPFGGAQHSLDILRRVGSVPSWSSPLCG